MFKFMNMRNLYDQLNEQMTKTNNKHKSSVVALQMKAMWGPEPAFEEGHVLTSSELSNALHWYHNMQDLQTAKDYLVSYLKANGDKRYKEVRSNHPNAVRPTAGFTSRILSNGYRIDETEMITFDRLINDSCRKLPDEPETPVETAPKPSIQDRISNKVSDIVSDLEDILDNWKEQKNFSTYDFLNSRQVAAKLAENIAAYYKPIHDEVVSMPKDREVREAYSHLSATEQKSYIKFVTSFYEDIVRYCGNTKAASVRRPRKSSKKVDPLKSFKYQKESTELKLKSIDPNRIIGASEVWMFDTKAFRIVVLRSDKRDGLDIKGTTIINVDEGKSETKRIRQSRVGIIQEILPATKTAAKKKFDDLTTVSSQPTHRTNDTMIILKVYK